MSNAVCNNCNTDWSIDLKHSPWAKFAVQCFLCGYGSVVMKVETDEQSVDIEERRVDDNAEEAVEASEPQRKDRVGLRDDGWCVEWD